MEVRADMSIQWILIWKALYLWAFVWHIVNAVKCLFTKRKNTGTSQPNLSRKSSCEFKWQKEHLGKVTTPDMARELIGKYDFFPSS